MYSFPAVAAGGYTAWKGNARVISRYSMSTVLSGAAPNVGMEQCCSRPVAMWLSGFMPEWAHFRQDVYTHIRSALLPRPPQGIREVRTDYGVQVGDLPKTCKDDISINPRISQPTNGQVMTWIEQKNDGLYLNAEKTTENHRYIVYDINGRIVSQGSGLPINLKLLDYGDAKLSSGMYITHVYANGFNQVFKTFKQ
jgi:hypothetical protein